MTDHIDQFLNDAVSMAQIGTMLMKSFTPTMLLLLNAIGLPKSPIVLNSCSIFCDS